MKLAYADPPYPGMAGLYQEQTEVDHPALIERLRDYDGWALSTDERSLAHVLPLCPPGTRVLAWCRNNAPPFKPNPACSWEPVLCRPARTMPVTVRSYFVSGVVLGNARKIGLTGQKPEGFCEWVIRCLGAEPGDTLDDIFPGTGSMGRAWESFQRQPALFHPPTRRRGHEASANLLRRVAQPFDGLDAPQAYSERSVKVNRGKGRKSAA